MIDAPLPKLKTVVVKASVIAEWTASVNVPEDWDEERVLEYYRENGASGEFSEDDRYPEWIWRGVSDAEEFNPYPDTVITGDDDA